MHRRTFLASLAGFAIAGPTAAQMKHDMSGHDMGAMTGHGGHDMPQAGASPFCLKGCPA